MAASVSTSHLLHHLLRPPPPAPPSLFLTSFIRPLRTTASSAAVFASKCRRRLIHTPLPSNALFSSSSPSPSLSRRSFASQSSLSHTLSSANSLSSSREEGEEEDDGDIDEIGDYRDGEDIEDFGDYSDEDEEDDVGVEAEIEIEKEGDGELGKSSETVVAKDPEAMMRSRREKGKQQISMTVKEKKDLASYANSLGKKLKSQLVGKGGITENVATSFVDTLEANELLKIKILGSCPGELDDVVKQLQELTTSVVVSKIGRTVVLYRPSITKMKEEERKKQAQKLYAKKLSRPRARPTYVKGGRESSRPSNRGRRGSSRFT